MITHAEAYAHMEELYIYACQSQHFTDQERHALSMFLDKMSAISYQRSLDQHAE